MTTFDTIGIYGRVESQGVADTLKSLIEHLTAIKKPHLIEAETAKQAKLSGKTVTREKLSKESDLVIVVGGDGSLLHAAHSVLGDETPILGINRGRLGFLTDILPTKLSKLDAIFSGDYLIEKRFLLHATVTHEGKTIGESHALNEVALIPDSIPHMNEFEVFIDNQFVLSQHSDGLIVATPTGSTAYALSGGGPILHPELNAIVMVPMFPHTLSIRPIVISGDKEIKITITPNNKHTPRITCDGQAFIPTPSGSHIHIKKHTKNLQLIHPKDYDYYETLRAKLHWGQKLKYSE